MADGAGAVAEVGSDLMDRRTFLRGATVLGSGVLAGAAVAGCSSLEPSHNEQRRHLHVHDEPRPARLVEARRVARAAPCSSPPTAATRRPATCTTASTRSRRRPSPSANRPATSSAASPSPGTPACRWRRVRAATATPPTRPAPASSSTSPTWTRSPSAVGRTGSPRWGPAPSSSTSTASWPRRDACCPGGSCPTVGIAGLALGGGIGVFARAYGLTCDQLAVGRGRDGGRHPAPVRAESRRGPLLGLPGRRRRQLRRRDVVRVPHPPHPRGDHPLHAGVALGRRRRRARAPGSSGSHPRPTSSGPTASSTAADRRRWPRQGDRRVRRFGERVHRRPEPAHRRRRRTRRPTASSAPRTTSRPP